ncbi:MAG TPA: DUF945 family protein, partial [Gammaproteobacteria bacterium]|nr:DUF945 family protein [Gammaproteobacteria bacterium]
MRKLSLFIFLILLAGIVATPFYFGYQIRNNFKQMVASINQSYKNLDLKLVDYHLGWLSSDAKLTIRIPFPATTPKAPPIVLVETIDSHITHGPLLQDPATKKYAFGLASVEGKGFLSGIDFKTNTTDGAIMNFSALIDFRNHWHTQFSQPVLSFSLPIAQFTSKGLTGNADFIFTNELTELGLVFQNQGFTIHFAASPVLSKIDLSGINYENHSQHQPTGVWTGQVKLSIPNIIITKNDNTQITSQETVIDSKTSSPRLGLYGVDLHVGVKNIQTASTLLPTLGPLNFSFVINDLNEAGLQALSAFFKSLQHQPLTPEERQTYLGLLPKILTPTTTISENLAANTALGAVQSDGTISWKNEQALPTTPQEMFQSMSVNINLSMASALVDQLLAAQG